MIDTTLTNGTQVAFSWTAPANDGGSVVIGYNIYLLTYDEGWQPQSEGQTDTFFTLTDLTAGNTYKFKVSATNSVGASEYTSDLSIVAASVPGPPTDLMIDTTSTNGT